MLKIYKIIITLIFIFFHFSANAHVQHYDKLNKIEFDIYRNNKHIGKHTFTFERLNSNVTVKSKIDFKIKKLGVVLYNYSAEGIEYFDDGILVKFNSNYYYPIFSYYPETTFGVFDNENFLLSWKLENKFAFLILLFLKFTFPFKFFKKLLLSK